MSASQAECRGFDSRLPLHPSLKLPPPFQYDVTRRLGRHKPHINRYETGRARARNDLNVATHPSLPPLYNYGAAGRPPLRGRGAFKIPSTGGVPERRGGFLPADSDISIVKCASARARARIRVTRAKRPRPFGALQCEETEPAPSI